LTLAALLTVVLLLLAAGVVWGQSGSTPITWAVIRRLTVP